MNNSGLKKTNLCEILVKTTYQVQVTKANDKQFEKPIGYGSGFIITYKDNRFFITADHVLNINDYENKERVGDDNIVSIFNNISDVGNFSTIITPLGGFYYMERFNITKPEDKPELIDVCLCKMKDINFQYHFLTDEVRFNGITINKGERKFLFNEKQLIEPTSEMIFFVYGKIKPEIKGLVLHRQDTIKENLKYVCKSGDYYLLNAPEEIVSYDDWAGLSGSPVINQEGKCIGVLCSINIGTNSVWVMPIDKIKMLMDIAICQEQLQQSE